MIVDPFKTTAPLIAASILSANFARLGAEMAEVEAGGADFFHLDVLDGHFAPNISFGPAIVSGARPVTKAYFDAHLMISEPTRYGPSIVKAGAQSITFHVEAVEDARATALELRKIGCHVGITLRPATPIEAILPALELVDIVLVMSVVPGFSGQKFMPEVLPKAREVKRRLRADQRMEIDGGINAQTIKSARDAGVDWFVVASAIFDHPDRAAAIAEIREKVR
jgi:ribulose-phosphate 3-epimerase